MRAEIVCHVLELLSVSVQLRLEHMLIILCDASSMFSDYREDKAVM